MRKGKENEKKKQRKIPLKHTKKELKNQCKILEKGR